MTESLVRKDLNKIFNNLKYRTKKNKQPIPFKNFEDFVLFAESKNFEIGQAIFIKDRKLGYVRDNITFKFSDKKKLTKKRNTAKKAILTTTPKSTAQLLEIVGVEFAEALYEEVKKELRLEILQKAQKQIKRDIKNGTLRRDYSFLLKE
jgi:hypothetical protein